MVFWTQGAKVSQESLAASETLFCRLAPVQETFRSLSPKSEGFEWGGGTGMGGGRNGCFWGTPRFWAKILENIEKRPFLPPPIPSPI